ncbi:hypothetical protein BDEG_20336 [Batrachochytrium dendrobatidis JEL423]|uniref:BRISC and BRCA1-A complex member 2 n=1 Tax=Batrachochytrium dendrobatidis (strain JEL423) TaxID=403673 RepID=A0A177W935_BATDL|nr:hypothetical protein BDEG_20336 [Batrachochytrium dendrobatidis JEL423]
MSSNVERLVFEIGCIAHVEDLELLVETNSTSLRKEYHVYVPVCYHETLADLDLNDPPKRKFVIDTLLEYEKLSILYTGAVLYVKYDMNQDNSAVNTITREFLSLKTMKPDTTIKLPSCDKDTLIVDYLAQIQDLLQKTQSIRLNNHAARERLVQCLVTEFAEYVLEYDDVDFSYVGLYINAYATNETKQTCEVVAGAVVNVHISALYPLEPIVIILSSPTKFQSSDSYIPESREWKLPFTRDMQPEDTVLAIKANVIEQIMRWFIFNYRKQVAYNAIASDPIHATPGNEEMLTAPEVGLVLLDTAVLPEKGAEENIEGAGDESVADSVAVAVAVVEWTHTPGASEMSPSWQVRPKKQRGFVGMNPPHEPPRIATEPPARTHSPGDSAPTPSGRAQSRPELHSMGLLGT